MHLLNSWHESEIKICDNPTENTVQSEIVFRYVFWICIEIFYETRIEFAYILM